MGRIKCVDTTTGFTVDEVYDVLGFVAVSGELNVATINDNGVFVLVDPNSLVFDVVELYGVRKVI
jgi:hypothetical protein